MLELINRDDYINKSHEEVSEELQKILAQYEEDIKDFTVEQAQEEEKRLMGVMDKLDEVIKAVEYELPKTCASVETGTPVSRKTIGKDICEILEKVECEYQYTLGYFQLYNLWKNPGQTITYPNLNSTLQVLGNGIRFRGPRQWAQILNINEYFKPLHNSYLIDNMILSLYGTCHSKLIDKIQLNKPVGEEVEPIEMTE